MMQKNEPAQTQRPRRLEKNYLVNRDAQFRILYRLGAVSFITTILICALSYHWILKMRPLFDETMAGPKTPEAAFQVIANLLLIRIVGVVVVMQIIFLIWGIILTHRLTGPIWKLERDLKRFLDGEDIPSIKFREKDEFRELPLLVNKLMTGYSGPRK